VISGRVPTLPRMQIDPDTSELMDTFSKKLAALCSDARCLLDDPRPVLNENTLAKFRVYRGAPLDINSGDPPEREARFFEPYPLSVPFIDAVQVECQEDDMSWPYCPRDHHRLSCANGIASWFLSLFKAMPDESPGEDVGQHAGIVPTLTCHCNRRVVESRV
jgi:hypothetical protein